MPGFRVSTVQHVMLHISDRRKTLPFYRDVVGLKIVPAFESAPGITMMETEDGTMLHLVEPSEQRPPPHVALIVDDFDAVHARLVELGYEIDGPIRRKDGRPALRVQDPDGNPVEFTTGPGPVSLDHLAVDEWGHTTDPRA